MNALFAGRSGARLVLGISALVLILAAVLITGLRDWLIWGQPAAIPFGVPPGETILLHNHLQGWWHAGTHPVLMRWQSWAVQAAAIWEWVPALLAAGGMACLGVWLRLRRLEGLGPRWLSGAAPWHLPARAGLPLIMVGALFCLTAFLSHSVFDGTPHVQDSIAQLFQARIFASGRLWAPAPPGVEFITSEFLVVQDGRWYSQYPPGHSALLALGLAVRAPWLINPLLGALSGWFLYLAAATAFSRRIALMSLALYVLSPFVWFMSSEYMNHASSMFWGSVALWAAARAEAPSPVGKRMRLLWPVTAGAAVGMAACSRPLVAVAFMLPLAGYWLFAGGSWRERFVSAGCLLAAAAVAVLPLLWFNWHTTGRPFLFGYQVLWGSSGFGLGNSQWGPPHTLGRGLEHLLRNLDALDRYLLEWPFPCLWLLAGLWWVRGRLQRFDYLLLAWTAALPLVHCFYFYQDLCFGPRLLYCAVPPLVILMARSFDGLGARLAPYWQAGPRCATRIAWRFGLAASAAGILLNVPVLVRYYSSSFWGVTPQFARRVEQSVPGPAIVFVRDADRAREIRLTMAGVSLRTAHSARVGLDQMWVDGVYLEALSAFPGDPARAGQMMEQRLASAVKQDPPAPLRRNAPWIDYRGPNGSFNQAAVRNTPNLLSQRVIYAVDLGPLNARLLAAYPNRTAWRHTWDDSTRSFRLVRLSEWVAVQGPPPPSRPH